MSGHSLIESPTGLSPRPLSSPRVAVWENDKRGAGRQKDPGSCHGAIGCGSTGIVECHHPRQYDSATEYTTIFERDSCFPSEIVIEMETYDGGTIRGPFSDKAAISDRKIFIATSSDEIRYLVQGNRV